MTTLHSSGMNTTTPQVNGGGATGWRTGHLRKTDECVNGTSFNRFLPIQGLNQLPVPALVHFKHQPPIYFSYTSQMSGNDIKITEEERWFKGDIDVDTVEISEAHW